MSILINIISSLFFLIIIIGIFKFFKTFSKKLTKEIEGLEIKFSNNNIYINKKKDWFNPSFFFSIFLNYFSYLERHQ